MCGRFILNASDQDILDAFDLHEAPLIQPRYNIAPTQPVLAVRVPRDAPEPRPRQAVHLHWGLIPRWADDPAIANKMINARSETAASKPSFRGPMKYHRCLIPCSGFYEWKKTDSGKQPQLVHLPDAPVFALAGLHEHWQDPRGNEVESCVILTTDANDFMKSIHDRMPVILPPDAYGRWLDPDIQDADQVQDLLQPYPTEPMSAYPVSREVNSPKNDHAGLIEPLDEDEAGSSQVTLF